NGKGTSTKALDKNSLVHKIQIKHNSEFYNWLQHELSERFDYACCEDLTAFYRLPRAITPKGQIKSNQKRHEKDDRFLLDDRSRYVLGWSNKEKIQTLQQNLQFKQQNGRKNLDCLMLLSKQINQISKQRDACRDLRQFDNYQKLDWQSISRQIEILTQEKNDLEETSDILKSLQQSVIDTKQTLKTCGTEKQHIQIQIGQLSQQLADKSKNLEDIEHLLHNFNFEQHQKTMTLLDNYYQQFLGVKKLHLQNISSTRNELRDKIQSKINYINQSTKAVRESIIRQMQEYRHQYPAETKEIDASIAAISEFQQILSTRQKEDLPKHEKRFKQLLNEGTINSIALFQNQLDKAANDIEQKVERINRSLKEIEYDNGTYIVIVTSRAQDADIRDFQQALKSCLSYTLSTEDLYNEQKFLQVKALIERFNGREGSIEADRRWRQKVTDVRNWFLFSASERWQQDHQEKQFHSDSSGKSGGQKEKLAYTILASALAYQFGLEWGETHSRSFRFVAIDEAFGKGSDDSTRYALKLFEKLNLQLLIVTPLQKIHVIEDHIKTLHFVHNQDGCNSQLKILSIDHYKKQKNSYQEHQEAATQTLLS
ncbi:ATP-binding protein, partial [Facilibium subflavum]|uniref:ATP-binding protein n=1 Tax=Facilibium subflavum TaxID=2219058 RepID=UPI0022876168